jgi:hypothetical protein
VKQQHEPVAASYRLWAAFAALPVVNAVVAFLGFPLVWYIGGHTGRLIDPTEAAVSFALLTGLMGLVVTVGGAIPVVLWLMRRGAVSLRQLIAAGVLLGNAPFVLYVIGLVLPLTILHLVRGTMSQHLLPFSDLIAGTLRAMAIGSVLGALSSLVFWFLGIRRADRSTPLVLR